jgi:hypothetical protein
MQVGQNPNSFIPWNIIVTMMFRSITSLLVLHYAIFLVDIRGGNNPIFLATAFVATTPTMMHQLLTGYQEESSWTIIYHRYQAAW